MGLALVVVLIVLPRMVQGDYYEIVDPLVFMGLPLMVVGGAVGAVVGVSSRSLATEGVVDEARRPRTARVAVVVVASAAAATAIWLFLWAVGAVDDAPWGIG